MLHIEVQAQKQAGFGLRLLSYRCHLQNLYDKPIISLVILIGYGIRLKKKGIPFWSFFPLIKIVDYKIKNKELENSENPFAHVILAQLLSMENFSVEEKLKAKTEFIKFIALRTRYN